MKHPYFQTPKQDQHIEAREKRELEAIRYLSANRVKGRRLLVVTSHERRV